MRDVAALHPHLFVEGDQLELPEDPSQLVQVGRLDPHVFRGHVERDVEAQGRKLFTHESEVPVLRELLPDRRLLYPVEVGVDRIEAAEGGDQIPGRLLPYAVNARYIVRGVAGKGEKIGDERGVYAEFSGYFLSFHHQVLHGVDDGDRIPHELHQVFVARHDKDLRVAALKPAHEGRDHVVRLEAFLFEHGDARFLDDVLYVGELKAQVAGHGRSRRLVFLRDLRAEGGRLRIPHHHQPVGFLLVDQLPEHVDEGIDRVRRHALRVGKVGRREERAIYVRIAVYKENPHH